jgi:hypothetical protein
MFVFYSLQKQGENPKKIAGDPLDARDFCPENALE